VTIHARFAAVAFMVVGVSDLSVCAAAKLESDTTVSESVRRQLTAGETLCVTHCANCHGSRGEGGIGPSLAGHDLSLQTIIETIAKGRTGTPMPGFKDDLNPKALADTAAFVLSLSSGGKRPTDVVTPTATLGPGRQRPSTEPVAVGEGTGTPARGAGLFFDATRLESCRSCHSYDEKGGPIGSDLSLLRMTPADVYSKLTHPRFAAAGYPVVSVVFRNGYRMAGVRDEETADSLSVFDVSSLPPVRRTFMKADISAVDTPQDHGVFDHTTLPYSPQELRDLSAFLGTRSHNLPR
jgi:mono/diheme cytochrome c family protein